MDVVTMDKNLTDKDKDMIAVIAGKEGISIEQAHILIADNMVNGKIIWNKKMRKLLGQHPKPFVNEEKKKYREDKIKRLSK